MNSRPFFARAVMVLSLGLSLAACGGGGALPMGDSTKGEAAVDTRMCTNCHGMDMSGTTMALDSTMTKFPDTKAYASNLTPDKETGLGGWTDDQIDKAMRQGIDDADKPMCEPMPIFSAMEDQEAADIIAYLRSLTAVSKDVPESSCPSMK